MSKRLADALRKRKHDVYSLDTITFGMRYCARRLRQKDYIPFENYLKGKPFPLSAIYEEFNIGKIDVVFVEQANLRFHNNLSKGTIVIYYHRDLPGTFNVLNPDLLLYRFKEAELFLSVYHRHEWYTTPFKYRMLNGICPCEYKSNKKKKFKGLIWTDLYRPLEYYMKKDVIQHDYYEKTYEIKEWLKQFDWFTAFETGGNKFPFELYKHIVERSNAVLIIPGRNAYVTRKCYEAAVCKSLIVLYIQNKRAEQVYKEWGLKHEINCIMFHKKEELLEYNFEDETLWSRIVDNAYRWAINNHTYKHRCDELLYLIDQVKERKKQPPEQQIRIIKKVELTHV